MKYYHIVIEHPGTGERKTITSKSQHPNTGFWKIVGVCGYFEK